MDLHVRVKPKSGAQQFYRCGMLFTLAWELVTVDEATARRLDEEQMLEVSKTQPVDFESPNAADPAGDGPAAVVADTPAAAPSNPAGETPALHTRPAELDASPVDPVSTTGEGVDAGGSVQAQAEAEARAQAAAESAAEPAPAKSARKARK